MALLKKIKQDGGNAEFWRVESAEVNMSTKYALITVSGYRTQKSFDKGDARLGVRQVEVRREKFDDFFSEKGNQFAQAEKAVVALDQAFSDAEKV
jgi:predicted SPOUT superfamily RNA methylase MTH1